MENTTNLAPETSYDTCDCSYGPGAHADSEDEFVESSPPPTSPTPLVPRQPILLYNQSIYQPESTEQPCLFYDPHTWFNEYSFTLEGDQEYIILLQGGNVQNYVHKAVLNNANGPLEIDYEQEPYSLCMLLHQNTPGVNLTVAARTSLAFLLQHARVTARLCYISHITEFCLQHDQNNIITEAKSLPNCNFLTAYTPLQPAFSPTAQQVAARNPLLLRRMRNLPKLAVSPLIANPLNE